MAAVKPVELPGEVLASARAEARLRVDRGLPQRLAELADGVGRGGDGDVLREQGAGGLQRKVCERWDLLRHAALRAAPSWLAPAIS